MVRPASLYGKSAYLLGSVFEAGLTGRLIACDGKPGGRFSLIHPDDRADVYVGAVEKAPILGVLAIDASNETTESVDDFLRKLIRISGAKEPHGSPGWIEPTNMFDALSTTVIICPYLAESLLGWRKRVARLTDGLLLYYAAWKASRSDQLKEKLFAERH